ncbi:MAG: OadG family protein [Clostridiales bacterium]|nr:OadG family protein [Clostridiales bacterium]
MDDITLAEAAGVSVMGFCVVFIVLVVLISVIYLQNFIISRLEGRGKTAAAPTGNAIPEAPAPAKLAKGSCGGVMLYDVPDRTAAMVMCIVADELKTPLNELRFISIQEVK